MSFERPPFLLILRKTKPRNENENYWTWAWFRGVMLFLSSGQGSNGKSCSQIGERSPSLLSGFSLP